MNTNRYNFWDALILFFNIILTIILFSALFGSQGKLMVQVFLWVLLSKVKNWRLDSLTVCR
ncbi:hypothetical protein C8C84_2536 [Flavobacterium sp. 102]|nr:hypothetical protein C8C84_2536 [Flavobacterium sp. 102]